MESHVEAIGGGLSAAFSVVLFYPLELIRVHQQTTTAETAETDTQWKLLARILRGFRDRGLALRVAHTSITSFVYYRIYSLIVLKRLQASKRSVWSNLVASNMAAMLTVLLAMPLEGLVLRLQKASNADSASAGDVNTAAASSSAIVADVVCATSILARIRSSYEGLTPALLLCLNPVIHYGVFDILKLAILNHFGTTMGDRKAAASSLSRSHSPSPLLRRGQLTYQDLDAHQLSAQQAFICGVIAKAIATLFTFPLLRAKVMMMTNMDSSLVNDEEHIDSSRARTAAVGAGGDGGRGNANITVPMLDQKQNYKNTHTQLPVQVHNELQDQQQNYKDTRTQLPVQAHNELQDQQHVGHLLVSANVNVTATTRSIISSTCTDVFTTVKAGVFQVVSYIQRCDVGRLIRSLVLLCRIHGFQNLYTGLWLHLIHTSMRAATSMACKEGFVRALRAVFVPKS